MKPKIFITQATVFPEALALLEAGAEVIWGLPEGERGPPKSPAAHLEAQQKIKAALNQVIGEIDGIFGMFKYDAAFLEAANRLRVIITPSSGAEHIDLAVATSKGICVVNAAGAAYGPVAEHVIGLSMSLLKSIALLDREVHATKIQISNAQVFARDGLPHNISGKTIGIIGLGFIGRELARMAIAGFGMKVLGYDPYFDDVEAARQGVTMVELDELLSTSDIVSVNCPATPSTVGMINLEALKKMKRSAILINCARGDMVVTDDLVQALKDGVIAGAGLDVTQPEPLPQGHPLFDFDNVVLTPHIGGVAAETLPNQSLQTAREGLQLLAGKRPFHLANPEVWTNRRVFA